MKFKLLAWLPSVVIFFVYLLFTWSSNDLSEYFPEPEISFTGEEEYWNLMKPDYEPFVAKAEITAAPNSDEIIDSVLEVYANASTYSDVGKSESLFTTPADFRTKLVFQTVYQAACQFRFSYEDVDSLSDTKYVIWTEGDRVFSWWNIDHLVEEMDNALSALHAAQGVSSGTSSFILSHLMPSELDARVQSFTDRVRLSDVTIDGVACYRIWGLYYNKPAVLVVEKESHLIRELLEGTDLDTSYVLSRTSFEPEMNTTISDESFQPNLPSIELEEGEN